MRNLFVGVPLDKGSTVQRYEHSPLKPRPLYKPFGKGCPDLVCFVNVRNLSVVHASASLAFESVVDRIQYVVPKASQML